MIREPYKRVVEKENNVSQVTINSDVIQKSDYFKNNSVVSHFFFFFLIVRFSKNFKFLGE